MASERHNLNMLSLLTKSGFSFDDRSRKRSSSKFLVRFDEMMMWPELENSYLIINRDPADASDRSISVGKFSSYESCFQVQLSKNKRNHNYTIERVLGKYLTRLNEVAQRFEYDTNTRLFTPVN